MLFIVIPNNIQYNKKQYISFITTAFLSFYKSNLTFSSKDRNNFRDNIPEIKFLKKNNNFSVDSTKQKLG